jgi:hypothetical protein
MFNQKLYSEFVLNSRGRDGGGQGNGNKPGSGPGGNCICPKCGHKEPHVAGQRCMDRTCPKCGQKMIRE